MGLVRGNTIYANIALHSNLNFQGTEKYTAPPEQLNQPTLKEFSKLKEGYQQYLGNLIFWQMGNEGMVSHSLTFNESEMIAEISQGRFRKTIKAIDLASRILANNSPKNIDKITIVNLEQGVETLRHQSTEMISLNLLQKDRLMKVYLFLMKKKAFTQQQYQELMNNYIRIFLEH